MKPFTWNFFGINFFWEKAKYKDKKAGVKEGPPAS